MKTMSFETHISLEIQKHAAELLSCVLASEMVSNVHNPNGIITILNTNIQSVADLPYKARKFAYLMDCCVRQDSDGRFVIAVEGV